MTAGSNHVTVVGAGVVGLCAARELASRGWRVTIVDRGNPGGGASGGNAGWVVPNRAAPVPAPGLVGASIRSLWHRDASFTLRPSANVDFLRWLVGFWRHCNARDYQAGLEATVALNRRTNSLFDTLQESGVRFESRRSDILYAYRSRETLENDLAKFERNQAVTLNRPQPLDGDALRAREPALGGEIAGGYALLDQRWVRPETLIAGLVEGLMAGGVEIRSNTAVSGFDHRQGRVTAVRTDDGTIASDAVLLCAGVWTPSVANLAGVRAPIQAGKGYSLDYADPPRPIRNALYLNEERLAVTPFEGMVRVAGMMELTSPNSRLQTDRLVTMAGGASRYLRDWPSDPMRASGWTGMRPLTPDGLPLIGWLPVFRNLAVAAGHAMLGMTLAPATAEAIAELMTDGRAPEVLGPFDPLRFSRSSLPTR